MSALSTYVALAFSFFLLACDGRANAQQDTDSFRLVPLWTRIGDEDGAVDEDRGVTSVESAEFSPNGQLIASAAKLANDVRVWDLDGRELWHGKHDSEVEVVTWTRDGRFVVTAGEDFTVRVWTAGDGTVVRMFKLDASIDGMRFSHRGHLLAVGTEAGKIHFWETSDPDPEKWPDAPRHVLVQGPDQDAPEGGDGHADVNSIDWTVDDALVVTAGRNAVVHMWDAARLSEGPAALVRTFRGFHDSIKSVRITSDGRYVAAGGQHSPDGLVLIWDAAIGEVVRRIDYPMTSKIEAVEFTPDGRFLVTGGIEGSERDTGYPGRQGMGHIRVYDRETGFDLALEQPVFRQEYFDFDPEGTLLVSSHEDGTLRLWRVAR